jgi:hypothetical protein
MARRALATLSITLAGVQLALLTGNDDGEAFRNDGRVVVVVENLDTNEHSVTFQTALEVGGQAVADLTVIVPASKMLLLGPFPPNLYNVKAGVDTDKIYMDYVDDGSNYQIGAFQL